MDEQINKLLFDIKKAIEEIDSYFTDGKNYNAYIKNKMLQRAVERNLEIIGEALNKILKIDNSIVITGSKQIIGLRNLIIHAYDSISNENIWAIINKHLPLLNDEVNNFLIR